MLWLSLGVPITEPRRAVRTEQFWPVSQAPPQSRLSHDSVWVSSHLLSFPSAVSESTIGGLSAAQRRESEVQPVLPEHDVLDPNGTSENMAGRRGRKAWPKEWSENVLAGIARLFQMAEFFSRSPHRKITRTTEHLPGKVVLYGEQRPSRPKGSCCL